MYIQVLLNFIGRFPRTWYGYHTTDCNILFRFAFILIFLYAYRFLFVYYVRFLLRNVIRKLDVTFIFVSWILLTITFFIEFVKLLISVDTDTVSHFG